MSTAVTGSPSQGQVASHRRLEAGIIVLALVMAVGCGWGLTRRLAEYR